MDGESAQARREGTLGYTSLTTAFSRGGGGDKMEAAAEEEHVRCRQQVTVIDKTELGQFQPTILLWMGQY